MVSIEKIMQIARQTAKTAARISGIEKIGYTLNVTDDPSVPTDGVIDIQERSITINMAKLPEFAEAFGTGDEDTAVTLEVVRVTAFGVRHLYQTREVCRYLVNQRVGENALPLMESSETCRTWLRELEEEEQDENSSALLDADAFANYIMERLGLIKFWDDNTSEETKKLREQVAAMRKRYDHLPVGD